MNNTEARQQFATLVSGAEEDLSLDRAALLIAAEEYPTLEIDRYLQQLDTLAQEFLAQLPPGGLSDPVERAYALAAYLFYEGRFTGNTNNYYDVRNSFLNKVMDQGKGIPITLSVIFIEVGRRLSLPLGGVGLPGHFLVKYEDDREEMFFDPFNGGKELRESDCRKIFEDRYSGQVSFQREFLRMVTKKQLLSRMLQNLKSIYVTASDLPKSLAVIERLLLITPGAAVELRDRGLVLYALKKYSLAQRDLKKYLRLTPAGTDHEKINAILNDLRQKQSQLN